MIPLAKDNLSSAKQIQIFFINEEFSQGQSIRAWAFCSECNDLFYKIDENGWVEATIESGPDNLGKYSERLSCISFHCIKF